MTDLSSSSYSLNNVGVDSSNEIKSENHTQTLIDENNALKKELASTKELLQAYINFPQLMTDSSSITKLVNPKIEPNIFSDVHNEVTLIMFKFFTREKVDGKLKSQKCDILRDLIKRGYSVTSCVVNFEEVKAEEKYSTYNKRACEPFPDTMMSPLLKYIICQDYIRDYDFYALYDLIELVKPTADLNITYGRFGTILDFFKRLNNTQLYNYHSYGTGRTILCTLGSIIEYLESIGAK